MERTVIPNPRAKQTAPYEEVVPFSSWEQLASYEAEQDKWPVWARLLIIGGLSLLLWFGIIAAAVILFG